MMKRTWWAGGVLTAMLLGVYSAPAADTWYVALSGDHTDFTNWTTAATNIQAAVDRAASSGDQVLVKAGNYALTNEIVIEKGLLVQGVDGSNVTFIGGQYPAFTNRCVYINHADAILDGFTITNGYITSGMASGVLISNGTLRNCVILRNSGASANPATGGGVAVGNGLVHNCLIVSNRYAGGSGVRIFANAGVVSNCVIAYNSGGWVTFGGGVSSQGLLVDCLVSNNSAHYTGGVQINGSLNLASLALNCVIVNNTCNNSVGGVGFWDGGIASNCIVRRNRGTTGGIIMSGGASKPCKVYNCTITTNTSLSSSGSGGVTMGNYSLLQNCLVGDNTGTNYAGGLYVSGTTGIDVKSCTIAGNRCYGGVGGFGDTNNAGRVLNTIIYNNSDVVGVGDNWHTWAPVGGDLSNCVYSCSTPAITGNGNKSDDPLFLDAASGNYQLRADSPCVNAGSNETWMLNAVDLDKSRRIFRGRVDMGAYENIFKGTFFSIQ